MRYEPPIIGVHYKTRASDSKKKVYTILLQKLVLHPYPEEAADQLYLEHPHILKEERIPKKKIVELIVKIQKELGIGEEYEEDYYGEEFEESAEKEEAHAKVGAIKNEPVPQVPQKEVPVPKKRPNFNLDNAFDGDHPLNRSM